jgi:hypothetical protein
MATLNLAFSSPASPPLNPAAAQAVLTSTNAWTLTVIKGSTHQQINTSQKFVKVGIDAGHFTQFCSSMAEPGPTKTVTFTYSGSVVSAMSFTLSGSAVNITLPDP